ncbi:MAG: sensor histidine kinase [Anaerolineae bacterium]
MSTILDIPLDRTLSDRVRWLIRLRWLTLALAAAMALAGNHWLGGVLPVAPLWGTFLGIALYNVGIWLFARDLRVRGAASEVYAVFMHVQVILDLVALTVLLHFSGGLENPFSTYYVLLVAIGTILTNRRAAYLYAITASVLWIGLLVLEAQQVLPHYNLVGFRLAVRYREFGHIMAESFVLATANLGLAYLASGITEKLRQGEEQLYDANTSCQVRAGELAVLNARLQDLDRTRSLFIRLVTHELRAPVAAIQSYLRLILDGYVPPERQSEIVAKAEVRARDQLDLISDLLDLARVQDAKDKPAEPVDAVAVLRDVVDMMQARAEDKRLTLTVSVAPQIPLVWASAEHLKQVWTNLVSNAVKYTPEGGSIAIQIDTEQGMLRGTVRDTGIGMTPEETRHLCETFYRTEAAKAMAHHGTGLGLSIVKGILDRYGGRLCVESVVNQGSTFTFELPTTELPAPSTPVAA